MLEANIKISLEMRDALTALKRGNDSYDDVIRRLVKEAKG